jgi:hypothetical protein
MLGNSWLRCFKQLQCTSGSRGTAVCSALWRVKTWSLSLSCCCCCNALHHLLHDVCIIAVCGWQWWHGSAMRPFESTGRKYPLVVKLPLHVWHNSPQFTPVSG